MHDAIISVVLHLHQDAHVFIFSLITWHRDAAMRGVDKAAMVVQMAFYFSIIDN